MNLLLYCIVTLIASYPKRISGEFKVYWPRGISWFVWRIQMGFEYYYSGFYIYYLSEYDPEKLRLIWMTAGYTEPELFQKYTSFVPTYLRKNCDSDGIDALLLHYYAAREDMRRNNKELKLMGGSIYYDNVFYHQYIGYLYNICNCLHGNSISNTCPDPCRKINVCVIEKNVVKGSCKKVPNKNHVSKLKDGDFKNLFGSLFFFTSECTCKQGYLWNAETKTCDFMRVGCSLKRIGERVCRNGGKCVPVNSKDRYYDFQILRCICSPAWTGYLCTEPVNPCKYSKRLCGSFICRRDETSITKGYYCLCTKGFRRHSEFDPRCINIDECQFLPCQHGGKCKDLTPDPLNLQSVGYMCTCIQGFTGENCEIPPKRPQWSMWGSWSLCSQTCGIGRVTRQRNCSEKGRCSGLSVQTTACILLSQSCDSMDESEQINQLKMSGVGWTPEEDRIIDDAFHWNEELFSQNPYDTLHYLGKLENAILIILCVLLIPFGLICLFNLIVLTPREWLVMTVKSHILRQGWIRGGAIGRERRKRKRKHKKFMKNIMNRIKNKNILNKNVDHEKDKDKDKDNQNLKNELIETEETEEKDGKYEIEEKEKENKQIKDWETDSPTDLNKEKNEK